MTVHTRLLVSVLAAMALASSFPATVSAKPPQFLICSLDDGSERHILIENFDGMRGAVHQCLDFWHGHPSGVGR